MDDDVAVVVGDEKQIPAPIRSETTLEDELVLDAPAQKTLNLYKVDNYTFGTKHSSQKQHERNPQRLKEKYQERGLRHSVAGVLLVHHHRHPHVLVLQQTKDSGRYFKIDSSFPCVYVLVFGFLVAVCVQVKVTWKVYRGN